MPSVTWRSCSSVSTVQARSELAVPALLYGEAVKSLGSDALRGLVCTPLAHKLQLREFGSHLGSTLFRRRGSAPAG
jgi:hypothetical protein